MKTCLFISALFVSLSVSSVRAEEKTNDIDWKQGAWGDLSQYIGTYNYDAVLKDSRVVEALSALMSKEQIAALEDRLEVKLPIGFSDDCLLLSGNAPASGGSEEAFVAVCVYKGTVHAVVEKESALSLYTKASQYSYLPYVMKLWISAQGNPKALDMPASVDLVIAP